MARPRTRGDRVTETTRWKAPIPAAFRDIHAAVAPQQEIQEFKEAVMLTGLRAVSAEHGQDARFKQLEDELAIYDQQIRADRKEQLLVRTVRPLKDYPVRVARKAQDCSVCKKPIEVGDDYHDGSRTRRAHTGCA